MKWTSLLHLLLGHPLHVWTLFKSGPHDASLPLGAIESNSNQNGEIAVRPERACAWAQVSPHLSPAAHWIRKLGLPHPSLGQSGWRVGVLYQEAYVLLLDCNPAKSNTKQLPILILHRFMPNTRCQTHLPSLPPTSIYLWRKICFSQRRDFHAPPNRSQIGGRPRPTAPSQSRTARTDGEEGDSINKIGHAATRGRREKGECPKRREAGQNGTAV